MLLQVNGQAYDAPPEVGNIPLAVFIKTRTPYKSVKVACGEGGCGACTVVVVEEHDGVPHLRTMNACLAPVYSVRGKSILTAEGLPAAQEGASLVADRLASFHASQCGYCTPGFTVACHAALHNAAAVAQKGSSATANGVTNGCNGKGACGKNGGSGGGECGASGGGGAAAGCNGHAAGEAVNGGCEGTGGGHPVLGEAALRSALDGNLCRCTGYRPIVAACRSLADIEDLGRALGATPVARPRTAADHASDAEAGVTEEVPLGHGQVLKAPRTLGALLDEAGRLAAASAQTWANGDSAHGGAGGAAGCGRPAWRLVAGNTGPGVFKDWPTEPRVLLSVSEVPELRTLEVVWPAAEDGEGTQPGGIANGGRAVRKDVQVRPTNVSGPHLVIGAAVTLERLAARLDQLFSPAGGAAVDVDGGCDQDAVREWAAETCAHLRRIAGRHVRNSATVGGNLALTASKGLPSDVATLLGAAGAEVELRLVSADPATHGSLVRADLMDFLAATGTAANAAGSAATTGALLPPGCTYILTAVRVPLPVAMAAAEGDAAARRRTRFWSQRVAERYSNAPAVANTAVMVTLRDNSGAGGGDDRDMVVEDVRIVVGVKVPADASAAGGAASAVVAEHNAAKLRDVSATSLDGWRCRRATAAEAALRGKPATAASVAAALAALTAADLAEARGAAAAAGGGTTLTTAEAIAEGLVAQGLMTCLGLATAATGATGAAVEADNANEAEKPVAAAAAEALPAKMPPPTLVHGRQVVPEPVPELAPVTQPVQKLGSKLQASGTAHYTEDTPMHSGALHAAFVLASRAGALLTLLDPSPALALPGVVRFLCAADLPSIGVGGGAGGGGVGGKGSGGSGGGGAVNRYEPAVGLGGCEAEPVFVEVGARCGYAGQAVGLILADSPWTAQRAAKAVIVQYGNPSDGHAAHDASVAQPNGTGATAATADAAGGTVASGPVLSIADAIRAGSLHPLPDLIPFLQRGSSYGGNSIVAASGGPDGSAAVDAALAAAGAPAAAAIFGPADGADASAVHASAAPPPPQIAVVRVVSGRYGTPSQLHFYMETQSAVAWPDEDGCVVVHSACQGTDAIQAAVATTLGLPLNKVIARCRRVGGGFGGKATLSRRVAAAAALAAVATGRQVRLQVPRNSDMAMCGGRCDTELSYVALLEMPVSGSGSGSGSVPRLVALDVHVVLQGGAYADISWLDAMGMLDSVTGLYDIPAFRAEVALARCNLPPRTAVRAPGEVTGTLIIEQIVEHLAVELGVDPEAFRQANFLKLPPEPPVAAKQQVTEGPPEKHQEQERRQEQPVQEATEKRDGMETKVVVTATAEPAKAAASPTQAPAGDSGRPANTATPPPAPAVVRMPLGKAIPVPQFTLPVLWERLQREAGWDRLKVEVESFNAASPWRKRGLAMLPARYGMWRGRRPAYVSLLPDGSVQVATHGVEMGQGLFTKVAQVASLTLSELLPPSRRPLPLEAIRIADNSSELLPNGGISGASITSELACVAVRLACLQLVGHLKAALPKMAGRDDYDLKDLIGALKLGLGFTVPMSAFAWGGQADLPESCGPHAIGPADTTYHVFGVALAVVEVDVLTGERRVLRADVMFDLGRPVNPAVDLGQVEGAFVQGLGMMLSEKAQYDSTTGALVQNSTWNYKPPAASCVPHQLNVTLLRDAPLAAALPLGSKACGEPPLLLSTVALMALQRATREARRAAAERVAASAALQPPAAREQGAAPAAPEQGAAEAAGSFRPLRAPATVERVREACGAWSAAELLAGVRLGMRA